MAESEPTLPSHCACVACRARDAARAKLRALGAVRVLFAERFDESCRGVTAWVTIADRVHAEGQGGTQEEALWHALEQLGLA